MWKAGGRKRARGWLLYLFDLFSERWQSTLFQIFCLFWQVCVLAPWSRSLRSGCLWNVYLIPIFSLIPKVLQITETQAWVVDAFEMFTSYCFPIFSLIPKVLQMTETLGGDSVPVRVTQPWITELLRLPVDLPVLAQGEEILRHPMTGDVH